MSRSNAGKPVSKDPSLSSPKPRWSETPQAKSPPAPTASPPSQVQTATRSAPTPTQEQISERARAIWKAGGCKAGRDRENWLEAERQLRAESQKR